VPVSMAIVAAQVAPSRRALGLGAIAAASEVGGLIGPLWGGGIAELLGWRGVFWVNLPMCLPIAASVLWLSSEERRGERRSLDLLGAAFIGVSLVCLTVALTDDPISQRPGWLTVLLYLGAASLFLMFLLRQARARSPIVDLRLFKTSRVKGAFLINCLAGGALVVAMVGVPLFTNVVLEDSALRGGLNLMRLTIALPVGALAGGYLAIRLGLASTATAGLLLAGAGFLGMSTWSSEPSFFELTTPLLVAGLGFGLVIAPVNEAVMSAVDAGHRATMASLLTVVRLVGALVGVALLTTRGLGTFYSEAGLINLDDPQFEELLHGLEVEAFQETFVVTAVVCFLTVLPALLIGRRVTG
jgi:MFS family permease